MKTLINSILLSLFLLSTFATVQCSTVPTIHRGLQNVTEDCFDDTKKFKYEDGKISCNDVATNTTLCESSWKASKKCEACGTCTPKPVEPEDCFAESKKFKDGDGKISCSSFTADPTLCESSWKASKKCEACGNCTPETTD
mmetsp:Transcript_2856/g.3419  ORF Transcript_2856/g.3419 Transcript_2856/m.3419 type:complete len:141 (+) Transcript_2856:16-438(+)